MRLIGIKFRNCAEEYLKKNLVDNTWYPFGDYEEPTKTNMNDFKSKLQKRSSNGLYKIDGVKEVNISCIVGKNGSGKSTIIDILLAIINNFAIKYVFTSVVSKHCDLQPVDSINASLFYELDKEIYEIKCEGSNVTFKKDFADEVVDSKSVAEKMFYTIYLDYSLYSHNTSDYKTSPEQSDEEVWLHPLFFKNDAYVTPVVMNPFRDRGNININKENTLAYQRLSALVYHLKSYKKEFLPGYKSVKITYKLNNRYSDEFPSAILDWDMYNNDHVWTYQWIFKYFRRKVIQLESVSEDQLSNELVNRIVNYMAYKAMKIARNYMDFSNKFNIRDCRDALMKPGLNEQEAENVLQNHDSEIDTLFKKIIEEETHITYKYFQAQRMLSNKGEYIKALADPKKEYYIDLEDVYEKNKRISYWDAMKLLPPPVFDLDIQFIKEDSTKKKEAIKFSAMSSGERQLLFSLSSIIYHLKNIECIIQDDNRIPYHNINIILDEAELYSHPEYQRTYINSMLDRLSWIGINRDKIYSINIIIATHSPFILSDIPQSNILYLEKGKVVNDVIKVNPFAANVNDILSQSFFLQEGFMGEFAKRCINKLIDALIQSKKRIANGKEILPKHEKMIRMSDDLIESIGDKILKTLLEELKEEFESHTKH